MVHPAFTVTRRILETLDEFPPPPDHLRYHGPRPRSWHPKITLYRLIVLTTTVILGTAKAVMTESGRTFVPITLEWVAGTFLFLFVSAYDSRQNVPSSLSWLFEHDCMNVVWRLVESFSISRPHYVSEENIVAGPHDRGYPPITAYRILVCSVVTAFGFSKATLGYSGLSTSVTWNEWAFAVPVTTFLYVLGLYEYNSLNRWPTFFLVDHSHKIYMTGSGMKTVIKYTVGPLICVGWTVTWGRTLWYTSQDPSWRVNPRPDVSKLTFGMRLVLDGPFIMGTLLLQGGIILAIIGGFLGLFFALRLTFLEALGKVRFVRRLLRAIRRLVMNTVAMIAPSSSENPFPDERIRVEHHPRKDIAAHFTFRVFLNVLLRLFGMVWCLVLAMVCAACIFVLVEIPWEKKAGILIALSIGLLILFIAMSLLVYATFAIGCSFAAPPLDRPLKSKPKDALFNFDNELNI
ncbi:hypothetical protein GALMADRAFT_161645 [Galerina marginata CBS 339.88]|uniref:Uncharacterized protein n=1 Tax=Galerina marginata (strain CBS 339.88) TaxID=685588 RepID=A0A067SKU5_GALM3|nr:hypothetical protein GALMADRAFT_161645 [Galerina marginata CBS 339.88]